MNEAKLMEFAEAADHWRRVAESNQARADDYDRLKLLYTLLKVEMGIDHGKSVMADAARWRMLQAEMKEQQS